MANDVITILSSGYLISGVDDQLGDSPFLITNAALISASSPLAMSLLIAVVLLSFFSLSFGGKAPVCDQSQTIYLKKNQNFNWPDTNHIEEGIAICYQLVFSDSQTYGSVNIHLENMNGHDKVWVKDYYNNEYYYPGSGEVNVKVMGPPQSVTLGLYKASQSSMKVKTLQVITVLFNALKTPKEKCSPTATTPCTFSYGLLQQGDTYQFEDAENVCEISILTADKTTWILVYDDFFNYMGPLGYQSPTWHGFRITLYVSWSGASGSVTIVSDDYQVPTQPPPPTFPTLPPTPPTQPPTLPPITFPPAVTNSPATTTGSNKGESTTVRYPPAPPKISARISAMFSLVIGLLFFLAEN